MRTIGRFIAGALLTVSAAGSAAAQECSDVLTGIYDFRATASSQEQAGSFANWFCNSDSVDSSGNATVPIKGVPFQFGGELNWAKERCGSSSSDISSSSQFLSIIQTVNESVVYAWQQCMAQPGFKAGVIYSSDPRRFHVVLSYVPVSASLSAATLKPGDDGFLISGDASCAGNWIQNEDRTVATSHTLTCTRKNPKEAIQITINSDPSPVGGRSVLDIAAYDPKPVVRTEVCLSQSDVNIHGTLNDKGWHCTNFDTESRWLPLGDDTGYRDQRLSIRTSKGRACFQHQRVGGAGLVDSGWVCASADRPSDKHLVGDDTGYRDQKLRIRWAGPGQLCARFFHRSPVYGPQETGFVCSSDNSPSAWLGLGDDTGYKDQRLQLVVR